MSDLDENEELKALARHAADQNAENLRLLYDEHSASFRWLMASLLALNGAGLLSLKDVKLSDPVYLMIAGVGFFFGLGCALLVAYIGQKSNQLMLPPVIRLGLYWRSVAITGELNEALQKEQSEQMENATRLGKWPSRAGIASFVCFTLGLAAVVLGWVFEMPGAK